MSAVTEEEVDAVERLYLNLERAEARRALRGRPAIGPPKVVLRGSLADRRSMLLSGRVEMLCGPCRGCIRRVLGLVPIDKRLCEF